MKLSVDVHSLCGSGSDRNEDSYYLGNGINGLPRLFVLADGLGGHADGAVASKTVTENFAKGFAAGEADFGVRQIISATHQELSVSRSERYSMGSTVAGLVIGEEKLMCFNVGDTRCYSLRADSLRQLSVDDLRKGSKNVLTQCLGGGSGMPRPHLSEEPVHGDEIFLILSDGITDCVSEKKLKTIVAAGENVAFELCAAAVANGSEDDCTAIVIGFCFS